jgi:UDP-2-acetamido-3-amino-2,3-dideoxy-glucuronate N-acetyltransferase
VLADVVLGDNVSVGSHAEIGRGTVIGANSRVGHGAFLPTNSRVGENVFIGPGVYCADDKHPRVNNPHYVAQPPVIEDHAVIGMGAVLLPGVHIGRNAVIGAGSVVTRDVGENETVYGEAARPRTLLRHLHAEHGWYH